MAACKLAGLPACSVSQAARLTTCAMTVVRGLVIVGLAYLAYTYFNPIRAQPRWLTEAELLPVVQSTAEVLLSVVPNAPKNVSYAPEPRNEVRQAPAPVQTVAPAQAARPPGSDPMADLIRNNGNANRVSPAAPEPVQQKSAPVGTETYGANDRQQLDKLIETGGNRAR